MKKHLLKLSTFVSMPLVSLAAISCSNSNNQNIPPRDYEMINNETGLAFNSEGKITKYYYFSDNGNSYENIVIPEYLENNRILTSQYYGYKQRITKIDDVVFSAETEYVGNGKYKPKYNDYAQYLTSITLPNSIETIGWNAFWGTPLTKIDIPDSVTYIDVGAFQNCKNLESVKLSKNTKYICSSAFADTAITNIEIPNSVICIYDDAFRNTKLSGKLVIPDSILEISSGAFLDTQITEVSIPNKIFSWTLKAFPPGCKITKRP